MANARQALERRKARVRRTLRAAANGRPRLSVFRSSKHIYAQIIDDAKGETIAAASSLEKDLRGSLKTGADIEAAKVIGKLLAERASPRASRTSSSIVAATSFTGASRRSRMPPAKAD